MNIDILFNITIICILVVVSAIDIKKMIIPNGILAFGSLASLFYLILRGDLTIDNILGSIIGFIIFLAIALVTNAIGGGDVKLIALIGFILGIEGVLFITVFSFFIGAVVSISLLMLKLKNTKNYIPFAPFISAAALLYTLYGEQIISFYFNMF